MFSCVKFVPALAARGIWILVFILFLLWTRGRGVKNFEYMVLVCSCFDRQSPKLKTGYCYINKTSFATGRSRMWLRQFYRYQYCCYKRLFYLVSIHILHFIESLNPISSGRVGVNLTPPPPCSFFYITQKVLVWGCWNFLTFPKYPKPSL